MSEFLDWRLKYDANVAAGKVKALAETTAEEGVAA
jgi:hypothetical protein